MPERKEQTLLQRLRRWNETRRPPDAWSERLIYKKKMKALLLLIQMVSVVILTFCTLNIGFWMEDSYSLTEMSKSYEETELFFWQADQIIRDKINWQRNTALFEQDGELQLDREIDIQSYGRGSASLQDMNTTYVLADLLDFFENGGWAALQDAVAQATESRSTREAGARLAEQAEALETIRPVTGISLKECSYWYSQPEEFLVNMYAKLGEVCQDVYMSYRQYTEQQDESWSVDAPSNLRYCITDTATGEVFTNLPAESCEEAAGLLEQMPEFTMLYSGERSFDIMVADPDSVLNSAAERWFLNARYVNTNEQVLVAVNRAYPVSDALQTYARNFEKRDTIVWLSVFGCILGTAGLVTAFVLLMMGAGLEEGRLAPRLYAIDRVPTELACGLYTILAVLVIVAFSRKAKLPKDILTPERIGLSLAAAAVWLLILSACTGFVRRLRAHMLWHNSICRMLIHTWRKVTAARAASGRLLFCYIVFFILNFVLLLFGQFGIFMVFVLDMAVLLYLLRDMAGKQSIWEGIQQISKGDLDYRIDTTMLLGETYEMAKAVNEMGDGLKEAVDAIVKNERLKAELITNVSHDLKTPLTSIVNYVGLLKRENLPGERVQHYIEVLDQKSQRLRQLTEDLVEVSKISSGNIELHMMRIQVQSMLQQAYGEFEERLEERSLTAVWELPKEPLHIMADGRQFWRVLENLLGNICKYALEGSQVCIRVTGEDGRVVIALMNTAREKLTVPAEELMGRFVRGDRSRNTEGSGLGLSIAQSLTELQGGVFSLHVEDGDQFCAKLSFPEAESEISVKFEAIR